MTQSGETGTLRCGHGVQQQARGSACAVASGGGERAEDELEWDRDGGTPGLAKGFADKGLYLGGVRGG